MKFEVVGEIAQIETIARGASLRVRRSLNEAYGVGNWRKMKGFTTVEYENGETWYVEIHWYEAHGIGKKRLKEKRRIRRIK